MCNPVKNVAVLKEGDEAIICCLKDSELSMKLTEMGCLPGTKIVMERPAPLGDPIRIKLGGEYSLSLRKEEAHIIMVR